MISLTSSTIPPLLNSSPYYLSITLTCLLCRYQVLPVYLPPPTSTGRINGALLPPPSSATPPVPVPAPVPVPVQSAVETRKRKTNSKWDQDGAVPAVCKKKKKKKVLFSHPRLCVCCCVLCAVCFVGNVIFISTRCTLLSL